MDDATIKNTEDLPFKERVVNFWCRNKVKIRSQLTEGVKDRLNIAILGMLVSYLFLLISARIGINLVWISFSITSLCAWYFAKRFYGSDRTMYGLFAYIGMLMLTVIYFALIYMIFGLQGSSISDGQKPSFSQAIYFSIVTWTTLGYGDLTPTEASMPWAMIEVLLGYIFMAMLVGKIIALADRNTAKGSA